MTAVRPAWAGTPCAAASKVEQVDLMKKVMDLPVNCSTRLSDSRLALHRLSMTVTR
jgi:hypothetical protein